MKINGYEYSEEEIFAALKEKGYIILEYNYIGVDETFPGGIETYPVKTYCAVRPGEYPSEKNLYTNVAIKEFQKKYKKPPLL